jgi:hypothetical protein
MANLLCINQSKQQFQCQRLMNYDAAFGSLFRGCVKAPFAVLQKIGLSRVIADKVEVKLNKVPAKIPLL